MKVTVEISDDQLDDIIAQQLLESISNQFELLKVAGKDDRIDMAYDLETLKNAYRFYTVEHEWSKLDEFS